LQRLPLMKSDLLNAHASGPCGELQKVVKVIKIG